MGAGWPIAQVARVLGCDPMDLHLLLREEPFAELFRAYCDLRSLPPEERLRRLREVALVVLEEAVEAKDPRVAWFVLRACELGHDPARTLARGIAAAEPAGRRPDPARRRRRPGARPSANSQPTSPARHRTAMARARP
jgi:hypothetical protein